MKEPWAAKEAENSSREHAGHITGFTNCRILAAIRQFCSTHELSDHRFFALAAALLSAQYFFSRSPTAPPTARRPLIYRQPPSDEERVPFGFCGSQCFLRIGKARHLRR